RASAWCAASQVSQSAWFAKESVGKECDVLLALLSLLMTKAYAARARDVKPNTSRWIDSHACDRRRGVSQSSDAHGTCTRVHQLAHPRAKFGRRALQSVWDC